MKMANPNEMVKDWISIVFGKERDTMGYRILLTLCFPLIPIFWVGWWTAYLIIEGCNL